MNSPADARDAFDAMVNELNELFCMLSTAAEVFGDYSTMCEKDARAAVVVDRVVDRLEQLNDDLTDWRTAHLTTSVAD